MVLDLRESMTLKHAARQLGVSDWTVQNIEQRYLHKQFAKPPLKHLRNIAINEISTKKGHQSEKNKPIPRSHSTSNPKPTAK